VETARLLLRPFRQGDLDDYHRVLGADIEVMRWLATRRTLSKEEMASRPAMFREHWERKGFGVWAVTDRRTGAFLGQGGLRHLEETDEVEVLYALGRAHWGIGYATECARACLRFGFEERGLERIIGLIMPDNVASGRVLEKAGLGYLRDDRYFDLDLRVYEIERARFSPDRAHYLVRLEGWGSLGSTAP
jgi:RimJ/RimL family protein N-acetyltransferase